MWKFASLVENDMVGLVWVVSWLVSLNSLEPLCGFGLWVCTMWGLRSAPIWLLPWVPELHVWGLEVIWFCEFGDGEVLVFFCICDGRVGSTVDHYFWDCKEYINSWILLSPMGDGV